MDSEQVFYEQADSWLEQILETAPVAATQLGEHRWDDRLSDYSPQALQEQHRLLLDGLQKKLAPSAPIVFTGNREQSIVIFFTIRLKISTDIECRPMNKPRLKHKQGDKHSPQPPIAI